MLSIIIADTSCLILLTKIGELPVLQKLYGSIIITSVIAKEYGNDLPDWMITKDPENLNYENILAINVDAGEASALALAIEQQDCLLILDDYKARKLANELKLNYTGTIGVLMEAYEQGLIDSMAVIVNKLKETNFYISADLEERMLKTKRI